MNNRHESTALQANAKTRASWRGKKCFIIIIFLTFFSFCLTAQDYKMHVDNIFGGYNTNSWKLKSEYIIDSILKKDKRLEINKMNFLILPQFYIDTSLGFKNIRSNLYQAISVSPKITLNRVIIFKRRAYQGSLLFNDDSCYLCLGSDLSSIDCSAYNLNFGITFMSLKKVMRKKPDLIFLIDKLNIGWYFLKKNQIWVCTFGGEFFEMNDYIQNNYSFDEMVEILRYGVNRPRKILMKDLKCN